MSATSACNGGPDVVVVGGGPAGLCSAIALAQRGVSVLLCESASEPGAKPCGEGLLPRALHELLQLGLQQSELLAHGQLLGGVRYISAAGRRAESHFAEGPGLGVRRQVLHQLLSELAGRTRGLRICRGKARLHIDPSRAWPCSVEVQGLLVTPRLVIGADGLCSGTRKAAAIRTLRPQPSRFGARQHFRVEPWTDHVEVFWAEGVEAYVTPVARDQVNVAFLWDDSVTETRGGQDLGRRLLRSFPELAARLRGVEASDRLAARGPLHVRVPMPARDGVLLVGDAAGYVDALTGEGVGLSALQARLLARRLARELRSSDKQLALEQLRPFLNETRRLERSHMVLTRLLLQLRRSPWLVEQLTGVFVKNPALFRYFLSLNQGRVVPLAVKRGLAI